MSQQRAAVPRIKLAAISRTFDVGGRREAVLESVDITAMAGEFVSIIGPSGCGKSTLLNIIAGLDNADTGIVQMEGDASRRRLGRIGYMQQKDLVLPWRSVLDNTVLGLELHGRSRRQARQRALELVETFGLKGFEKLYPIALSGGMRQRVAFMRTMLLDQDVILLDEPFGALDALTRGQMQEWLLQLWEALNQTIILITHDVDEAILLSDRVYVLTARPGRVKMVLDVELPRPRNYHSATTREFTELKATLLATLHEESSRQSWRQWDGPVQ
ncbi:MAG TPA: ABC transporter ATP-binding protein [Dehalococcoidia bacterium]|nr:ABC transporter ATP-binding protein [Dehalococcoidia bacterium]